jgi:hypothetical protein
MKVQFGKKNGTEAKGKEEGEDAEGVGGDKAASALGAYDVTEHMMSHAECADRLGTSIDLENPHKTKGLTKEEVRTSDPGMRLAAALRRLSVLWCACK